MTALPSPIVIRAELPTPDIVVVRTSDGRSLLFADNHVTQTEIDRAVGDIDAILAGPAYPLGAAQQ